MAIAHHRFPVLLATLISSMFFTACGGGGSATSTQPTSTQTQQPAVTLSVNPSTANIAINQTQAFTATVSNSSNQAVTWSVQEGSTGGSITSGGAYTPPNKAGTYHVVAAAQADSTRTAIATVTVTAPPPSFASTAPTAAASEAVPYTYAISATDPASGTVSFQLTSSPAGATISGNTLTWTPSAVQGRIANNFLITATTSEGGTATQSFSVTPAGTVRGVSKASYVTTAGVTTLPDDTTTFPINALVPNGKGGFTSLPGTGSTDGTFTIRNVPAGYFWLQYGDQSYFWTNTSNIDMGYDVLGRPDLTYPSLPTSVSVTVSNASPFQNTDDAQIVVPNTGAWVNRIGMASTAQGSTVLTDTVDWSYQLSNASKGDQIYVTQLQTKPAAGITYAALTKVYGPAPFTQTDGGIAPLSGAFTDVPQDGLVRGAVKGSAFAALTPQMGTGATDFASFAAVDTDPAGESYGPIGAIPDLLEINTTTPIVIDVDMGDLTFGDPYTPAWTRLLYYAHFARLQRTAPGATTSIVFHPIIQVITTALPTAASPVVPLIGPVTSPTINGLALTTDQSGVGLTPALAWANPTVGSPTGYGVDVYQIFATSTANSRTRSIARLTTKVNSIQVPPGLMTSGSSYLIRITSRYQSGINLETAPYRLSYPDAWAQFYSAVVSP